MATAALRQSEFWGADVVLGLELLKWYLSYTTKIAEFDLGQGGENKSTILPKNLKEIVI